MTGMDPLGSGQDAFRLVEELYHDVCEASGHDRVRLLSAADPEVRREVESLLEQQSTDSFLDRPAIQNAAELFAESTCPEPGSLLGPYRIEAKLGEGGMGEVFRAVDTRLGRAVAIKTTQARFSAHFEREARAISSLNHPNICTLYDVGSNFLVMELVEGQTLAARLKEGPLPVSEALNYANRIMAALVEAHAKGVVHRDLKPGNIMVSDSMVKVLDFGLAKSGRDDSVTVTGPVMGTPAYMAPEQREGKPSDARADIFSFGCVLHEMLTGLRPGSPRKRMPTGSLEKIVNRCLEQDPEKRWQSAALLSRELAALPSKRRRLWIASAALVFVAFSSGGYLYLHKANRLEGHDTLVLADFENTTGDTVFDATLRQGLSVELQQSQFLTVIPDQQVQQTLALMGQRKDARLSPEIARQICERTAGAAVLEGSIARLGSQFVVGLRAKSCKTGKILDQEQIQAVRREDVLNSLSQIARKFRIRVGESLATVEKYSTPLAEATTPSLEALKAYSTGVQMELTSGHAAGIPFYRKAVEIDPQFAVAHAFLSFSYSNIGESVLSVESGTRAWKLRDRASDRERFFLDFNYYRQVTGNLEKAFQTLEAWARTYPRGVDPDPRDLMAGLSAVGTGRFEVVIEQARKSVKHDPEFAIGYWNLAIGNFFLDRFGEARDALDQAHARKLELPAFAVYRYNTAFLQGDRQQMEQAVARAKGWHSAEHWMAHSQALVLAASGRLAEARAFSRQARNLAKQEGRLEAAATYQAAAAVWEALYGNHAEAKRNALEALALSSGRDVEYAAGLALAFCGESSRSQTLARDLEKRFPEDTFASFTYVPVLRAASELGRGRAEEAVEQLQPATRYEFAVNGLSRNLYMGGLHSAYVRGLALTAAKSYSKAAAEFQKILEHRGVVGADPIGVLAHIQLGRVYSLAGDKLKAKAEYESFSNLWREADPGVPISIQSRAEYAKLR